MTKVPYYPGCALSDRSSQLDRTARDAAVKLGFELEELENWTCCGAVPPVSTERIMNLVPSARVLRDVRDRGGNAVVTLCDFCYNTLKRTHYALVNDPILRKRLGAYLADDEPSRPYLPDGGATPEYAGEVRVFHYLEYLRDVIGYEELASRVVRPLEGLCAAPYYGCVLLRPRKEIGLDCPENPTLFEGFLSALGARPAAYPYRTECCGSYLSVSSPEASTRLCHRILRSARDHGAHALVVSCPLCFYNLDSRQEAIAEVYGNFQPMPVFYFTQLLSLALGNGADAQGFEKHRVDVSPALERIGAS